MKEIKQDLWHFHDLGNWICVTTNSSVKKDGRLVMGGGCALEAAIRVPQLERFLGDHVLRFGNICAVYTPEKIISFPTKGKVQYDSTTRLIESSARRLVQIVSVMKIDEIYIPRPGCGLGGLDWNGEVKPILEDLFDDRFIIVSN